MGPPHERPLVSHRSPQAAATGADPRAARGSRPGRRAAGLRWLRLLSPIAAVGLWQAASSSGILPASKLASPASIAHTAYTLVVSNSPTYGTLQASLLASCERWAIGLAVGVMAGVLLAVVTG